MITGIAAALSMAASEYLSTKTENNEKNPFLASIYTGIAYIINKLLVDIGIKIPPQVSNSQVRTTVYGFPICVFHKDNAGRHNRSYLSDTDR